MPRYGQLNPVPPQESGADDDRLLLLQVVGDAMSADIARSLTDTSIELLDLGDGTVATPAWTVPNRIADRSDLDLPNGWALRAVELTDDLVASIPNPAKVAILADGSGFHGPVSMALKVGDITEPVGLLEVRVPVRWQRGCVRRPVGTVRRR